MTKSLPTPSPATSGVQQTWTRASRKALGVAVVAFALTTCGRTEMDPPVRAPADAANSGPCSEVPCLASLIPLCQPQGSCLVQTSLPVQTPKGTSITEAYCFDNGIKIQLAKWATNADAGVGFDGGMTVKFERGSSVCFDYVNYGEATSPNSVYQTYHDGKGRQVATAIWDFPEDEITVTCAGGQTTVLSNQCRNLLGNISSCNVGPCVF
jgi:hypothetical protein